MTFSSSFSIIYPSFPSELPSFSHPLFSPLPHFSITPFISSVVKAFNPSA